MSYILLLLFLTFIFSLVRVLPSSFPLVPLWRYFFDYPFYPFFFLIDVPEKIVLSSLSLAKFHVMSLGWKTGRRNINCMYKYQRIETDWFTMCFSCLTSLDGSHLPSHFTYVPCSLLRLTTKPQVPVISKPRALGNCLRQCLGGVEGSDPPRAMNEIKRCSQVEPKSP